MPLTMNDSTTPSTPASAPQAGNSENKFPALPDGEIVNVEVVRCTIKPAPHWEDYANEVSFGFRIIDDAYRNRWVWGGVEARLEDDPACTLTEWIKAILGVDGLPEGFEFDESEFAPPADKKAPPIGDPSLLRAKVQVNRYYSKKHDEHRNSVVAVLPMNSGGSSAAEVFGA